MFEDSTHPCLKQGCTTPVPYDDEPYCYEHTPNDKSSNVPGYSYKATQTEKVEGPEERPAPVAMERDRVAMVVIVDRDPVPGTFHTPESVKEQVEAILLSMIGHYHPVVLPFDE